MKKSVFKLLLFLIISGVHTEAYSQNEQKNTEVNLLDKTQTKDSFKVLSLNTWHEATAVDGGFQALVEVIIQSEAAIIMLSEINNYKGIDFSKKLVNELKSKDKIYYSFNSEKSPIILSKYPIVSKPEINNGSLTKCIVQFKKDIKIAIYAAHLDYTRYACYLPRGYDGITWKKLPEPVVDITKILEQNKASARDESIEVFVNDAAKEQQKGNWVLLAGDFNEPSHLDWTEATKNLFDHNGTIVPWHNSVTLKQKGYLDAYRVKYPNPVTHPGFTWTAYNRDVEMSKLVWTPEADDRDRIDFIYFNKDVRLSLEDVIIVGPSKSMANGKSVSNTASDKFLEPKGKWPTDHKGVLATFKIKN